MQLLYTDNAPAAIGPYSQAVAHQGLLFASGQIALSPKTGELVGNNAREQAQQCLTNLGFVLREGGAEISTILKVVIYLKNMDDFSAVNEIYKSWIGNHRPARSTIAASGLPRGALVEIECIASIVSHLSENK